MRWPRFVQRPLGLGCFDFRVGFLVPFFWFIGLGAKNEKLGTRNVLTCNEKPGPRGPGFFVVREGGLEPPHPFGH